MSDAEESVNSHKFCMRVYQIPLIQKALAKLQQGDEEVRRVRNRGEENQLEPQNGVRTPRHTHAAMFLGTQLSFLTQGLIYHSCTLLKLHVE